MTEGLAVIQTKRKTEADVAWCKDCEMYIFPSLYWGLRTVVHLHSDGMGHKRFSWWRYAW